MGLTTQNLLPMALFLVSSTFSFIKPYCGHKINIACVLIFVLPPSSTPGSAPGIINNYNSYYHLYSCIHVELNCHWLELLNHAHR